MRKQLAMPVVEQVARAVELGHDLQVETRIREDFPDAPPKFFLSCSCGWKFKAAVRSIKAANIALGWHVGYVVAEDLDDDQGARTNGLAPRRGGTPAQAG